MKTLASPVAQEDLALQPLKLPHPSFVSTPHSFRALGQHAPLLSEQEVLAGLYAQDAGIIHAIHAFYYTPLLRFTSYRLRDPYLAEDLVAEVFTRLLEAVKAGRGPHTY